MPASPCSIDTVTATEQVIATVAAQQVIATQAEDQVRAVGAQQRVVAVRADFDVAAPAGRAVAVADLIDGIGATTANQCALHAVIHADRSRAVAGQIRCAVTGGGESAGAIGVATGDVQGRLRCHAGSASVVSQPAVGTLPRV
ncbi:MAG: hypothetical protein R3E79_45765 [Caldilineaceae bacterium]